MIFILEEDWLLNDYQHLKAARVNSNNTQKKMDKFLKQVDNNNDNSMPTSPETVDESDFEIVISSDEKKEEDESDNDDFVINDDIE